MTGINLVIKSIENYMTNMDLIIADKNKEIESLKEEIKQLKKESKE